MKEKKEDMPSKTYYFPVIFEKGKMGYAVRVVGFDNILTSGDTLEEAEKNVKEAIKSHIGEIEKEELSLYTSPPEEVTVKVITIKKE